MSIKIVQLGYGKMGRLVLDDLLQTAQFDQLVVADARPGFKSEISAADDQRVKAVDLDVDNREELLSLLEGADVVVELLPIRCTMQVAQAAVEAGAHLVSSVFIIDWSVQDPEGVRRQQEQLAEVDRIAKEKGLTILREFGMDPGLDLVVAGEAIRQLDEIEVLYTYGAGFPEHRLSEANPIGYKFTWSIIDTMYSYSIPGRIIRDGIAQEIPADGMFTPGNYHHLDLEELGGSLECFVNGDGESLARLFPAVADSIRTMGRFICRWPGHAAFWEKMVQSGFNRSEPVNVDGVDVIPAAFCAALLGSQEQFHYGEGEKDVALIRADARGIKNGQPTRVLNQIIDYRDLETGYTAMQRTVAFPMSIGAQMILDGRISQRGIVEPSEVPFQPLYDELKQRGLEIEQTLEVWDGSTEPVIKSIR
jgi:saccharopine dehydrogenase-like NADP-dependent oxidoreductase